MGIVDYFLAPRKDHRGWNTPNEASRILFFVVLVSVSIWAWPISEGRFVIWIGIILLFSTGILTIVWWFLSLLTGNRKPRKLTTSLTEN